MPLPARRSGEHDAKKASVALAEEPTAALDRYSSPLVAKLLNTAGRERAVITQRVTHAPQIRPLANEVLLLRDRRMAARAKPAEEVNREGARQVSVR